MTTERTGAGPTDEDRLAALRRINATAAFNRWCGIEVTDAGEGRAVIEMPWRADVAQYTGFLHAGLVGTLIDTACGFAAATMGNERLLAAHFAVNCLRPAVGERFVARAPRRQAGTHAVLHGLRPVRAAGHRRDAGGERRDASDGGGSVRGRHVDRGCPAARTVG